MTRHHELKEAEQRRVADLLAKDRVERAMNEERERRRIEKASGGRASERELADGPTPEQLAKGDFRRVAEVGTGDAREGADVYRRMSVPTVQRMAEKGQISEDALRACKWYSATYEFAGLYGKVRSVDMGREVFGGAGHSMFTDSQLEALDALSRVRQAFPMGRLKFFEAVVIGDIPITRACRFARLRRSRAMSLFSDMAENAFSTLVDMRILD